MKTTDNIQNCSSWSSDDEEGDEDVTEDFDFHFYPVCCRETNDISKSHATAEAALKYDMEVHGFDLLQFLPSHEDENFFEQTIKCVNKCRAYVSSLPTSHEEEENDPKCIGEQLTLHLQTFKEEEPNKEASTEAARNNKNETNGDDDDDHDNNNLDSEFDSEFFRPVLMDDSLLMCIDDLEDLKRVRSQLDKSQETVSIPTTTATAATTISITPSSPSSYQYKEMQSKILTLEEQLIKAKHLITQLTIGSNNNHTNKTSKHRQLQDNDTYYFKSYSHTSIHETMIRDKVRTDAYRNAIFNNSHTLFQDKIVMDIGCGTGILSLFAAKAGAKKVIAVDASDIYIEATEIIKRNHMDHIITVLHGKVEDLISNRQIPLAPNEKVDVIISEWMGYALFFETMLPSVMAVRDTFMNKDHGGSDSISGGTMYPNNCSIYLEGASDDCIDFWDDVYGIDMTPMKQRAIRENTTKDAIVEIVPHDSIVTDKYNLRAWDLNLCKDDDLDFKVPFCLKPLHKKAQPNSSDTHNVTIHKLVISFDVDFNFPGTNHVNLSTGCDNTPTHWKQTTIFLKDAPTLEDDEIFKGIFQMTRNGTNHRDIDFYIEWEVGRYIEAQTKFIPRCTGKLLSQLLA